MTLREKPAFLPFAMPLVGVALVTAAAVRLAPVAPAQFYPVFIALTLGIAAVWGRGPGFVSVGASALAIAFFSLSGVDFAVADPVDAAGLIGLIAADILVVIVVAGQRDCLEIERERCDALKARGDAVRAVIDEMSHRLKNDLGSLAAIARLRAARAEHPETIEALASFAHRIAAQARIYDRFDSGQVLGGPIALKDYIERLCDDFRLAHLSLRPVRIEVDVAEIGVAAASATILGSIVNELLTNASKHAFPEDRPGAISVLFGAHPMLVGRYRLTVADDGVGFCSVTANGNGIGRKLLAAMASQLGGELHLARVNGMTVGQVDVSL